MPDLGDDGVHLQPRKLPALTGLGALRHLDLQLARVHEVVRRDPEAAGGHLLDGALGRIPVGKSGVARLILPAFTAVARRAQAVHPDGERLMRFLADGTEGHGGRDEALHDGGDGLHMTFRNGRARPESE